MKDLNLKFTDVRDLTTQQEKECFKYDHLGVVIVRNSDGLMIDRKLVPVRFAAHVYSTYRHGTSGKPVKVQFTWLANCDADLFTATCTEHRDHDEDVEIEEEYVEVSHVNLEYWDFEQLDEE